MVNRCVGGVLIRLDSRAWPAVNASVKPVETRMVARHRTGTVFKDEAFPLFLKILQILK